MHGGSDFTIDDWDNRSDLNVGRRKLSFLLFLFFLLVFQAPFDIHDHLLQECLRLLDLFSSKHSLEIQLFLDVFLLKCLVHVAHDLRAYFLAFNFLHQVFSVSHETIHLLSYGRGKQVNFDLSEVFLFDWIEIEVIQVWGDFTELVGEWNIRGSRLFAFLDSLGTMIGE